MSIITTAPPLSTVTYIPLSISLRLARCFIATCSPFDRLDRGFFTFFILISFMSFWTRSMKVLGIWCVSLGNHFVLFLNLKGWYIWSDVFVSLASLMWALTFKRQKKYSVSVSSCFWPYCFGVCTKFKFLFKTL